VFLTNALTGWEPHKDTKKFAFPELEWEIAWTRNSHRGSHGSEPDGPQASRAGVAAAHVKRELPAGAQARLSPGLASRGGKYGRHSLLICKPNLYIFNIYK
jgi:hypothetical protein